MNIFTKSFLATIVLCAIAFTSCQKEEVIEATFQAQTRSLNSINCTLSFNDQNVVTVATTRVEVYSPNGNIFYVKVKENGSDIIYQASQLEVEDNTDELKVTTANNTIYNGKNSLNITASNSAFSVIVNPGQIDVNQSVIIEELDSF